MLATLLSGPKHGYQLKREAGFIFGQDALHNNLVYPLLRRFMKEGWVTKKTLPGERGQTRQQYTITHAGRRALLDRLSAYTESDAHTSETLLLRVALFDILPFQVRNEILNTRENYLRQRSERLAALPQHMQLDAYVSEILRHLRKQSEAEIEWIARLRRLSKQQQAESA
jgi:DNA-binding PadR family transcriptional regulator